MHVLVTGVSGYFGRLLLPALLADENIMQVTGVDRRDAPLAHPRYRHVHLELGHARPADWQALGADVAYHMAFQMCGRPGEDTYPGNVAGQAVALEALAATSGRLVVTSSVAGYGFSPGRDVESGMLDESAALTPGSGIAYAEQTRLVEQVLDHLDARSVVRARITNVVGPTMPRERAPLLAAPAALVPMVRHPLRQQLLHEQDLLDALLHLPGVPPGAYNVAPDDWSTMQEMAALLGQRCVPMPSWSLRAMADVAWRTGQNAFDGSWLGFLEHPPIIVSNAKLKATGWAPRFTSRESFMLMAGKARAGF